MSSFFGGLADRASPLFGGQADPRISPEANQSANKQGLIQAGLSTIIGSGPGGMTPLQAIAAGLIEGQQAGGQARASAFRNQSQQQMADIVAGGGPTEQIMTDLFKTAVANGDVDAFRALSGVLPTILRAGGQSEAPNLTWQTVEDPDNPGRSIRVGMDPKTGEQRTRGIPVAENNIYERIFSVHDPETGTNRTRGIVAGTGQVVDLGEAVTGSGGGSDGTTRMNDRLAQAMMQAEEAFGKIPGADTELARPIVGILANMSRDGGFLGSLANGALAMASPIAQQAAAAREQWTAAAVRLISGAQMTEQERNTYRAAYSTQPSDTPAVQRQKALARGAFTQLFLEAELNEDGEYEGMTRDVMDRIFEEAGLPVPVHVEEGEGPPQNQSGLFPPRGPG